jgi:hypothetical protein
MFGSNVAVLETVVVPPSLVKVPDPSSVPAIVPVLPASVTVTPALPALPRLSSSPSSIESDSAVSVEVRSLWTGRISAGAPGGDHARSERSGEGGSTLGSGAGPRRER